MNKIYQKIKKLISFQTTADKTEELKKCCNYISGLFRRKGLYVRHYIHNEKPSLVISTRKKKSFDMIMCGHIDVVPAGENEFKPKIRGKRLYGRGSADMKSAVAVMVQAMLDMPECEKKPSIALMLSSDEEVGGFNCVEYLLKKEKYKADFVFLPDGGRDFKIVLAEKGVIHIRIEARGKTAHGSRPWLGENAIEKLIEVYTLIKRKFPEKKRKDKWFTTVNLGRIEGGDATNKVPDSAYMSIDIRHPENVSAKEIANSVDECCMQVAGVMMKVIISGSHSVIKKGSPYVKRFKKILEKRLGRDVEYEKGHGSGDRRFFYEAGIPVLMATCRSSDFHIENEWVDLKSVEVLYGIVSDIIDDLEK